MARNNMLEILIFIMMLFSGILYVSGLYYGAKKKYWTRYRFIAFCIICLIPVAIAIGIRIITAANTILNGILRILILLIFIFLIGALGGYLQLTIYTKEPYKKWLNIRE